LFVELCPKLGGFVFILLPTLAPADEIFRARWLYAQNWGQIGIADKCTHAFPDNVDNMPPAVNAINLLGFAIKQECDRFSSNKSSQMMDRP
jgi:hypothetical protein